MIQMTTTPRTLDVVDKATVQVVRSVPVDDAQAVAAKAARAREAQVAWAALPVKQRCKLLKLARKELMRDLEKVREALGKETGKPPADVLGEIFFICSQIGHYAGNAVKWLETKSVGTFPLLGKKGLISYRPRGVVGVIAPWNAPLTLAIGDAIPALFAGNAVLVKPSEVTPLAVQYAIDAFNRVLPEGVLQCVMGDGPTGAALVDHVDLIAVTGSCETGRRVMERASKRLTPVLLELGGKDPMIVLNDADMERATTAAAWGSCFMTGQVCMSIERIYVEQGIAREFKEKLREKLRAIRTGPNYGSDELDYGPFIGPQQVRIVEEQLADAQAKGAQVELGGTRILGDAGAVYFPPTLVTNVDHRMKLMTDETFGPVACVMEVRDAEHAIALANDSIYGLNASVWTRNIQRGLDIAARIQSGNVCVNDAVLNAGVPALPFGGIKQSGVGSRHGGADGLRAFCYAQSVMVEKRNRKTEPSWFPYTVKTTKMTERIMKFMYGRGL